MKILKTVKSRLETDEMIASIRIWEMKDNSLKFKVTVTQPKTPRYSFSFQMPMKSVRLLGAELECRVKEKIDGELEIDCLDDKDWIQLRYIDDRNIKNEIIGRFFVIEANDGNRSQSVNISEMAALELSAFLRELEAEYSAQRGEKRIAGQNAGNTRIIKAGEKLEEKQPTTAEKNLKVGQKAQIGTVLTEILQTEKPAGVQIVEADAWRRQAVSRLPLVFLSKKHQLLN
jgi:hypothetical protein